VLDLTVFADAAPFLVHLDGAAALTDNDRENIIAIGQAGEITVIFTEYIRAALLAEISH
jgi:hypothetical protein